jgi:hypothetical protein
MSHHHRPVFYLEPSSKSDKKWQVTFLSSAGREKTIHFGAQGYEDYTMHKTLARKEKYIQRHSGMGEHWRDPTTAGFWSRWLLWNKPTLKGSAKDIEQRFGIKIKM